MPGSSDQQATKEARERARATERARREERQRNAERWAATATHYAAATATTRANLPPTCLALVAEGYQVSARYGLSSGIECKRVGAREIGNAQVIAMGFLDAVDIWGYAGQGYELCFPQIGKLVILDARTAPRTLRDIPYFYREGFTCAQLDYEGTLVLLPGDGGASDQPSQAARPPASAQPQPASQYLTNCMVTLTHVLNFRATPGGEIIGQLPYRATLTAYERAPGWFKVDYWGRQGWISADYVLPVGDCGT